MIFKITEQAVLFIIYSYFDRMKIIKFSLPAALCGHPSQGYENIQILAMLIGIFALCFKHTGPQCAVNLNNLNIFLLNSGIRLN